MWQNGKGRQTKVGHVKCAQILVKAGLGNKVGRSEAQTLSFTRRDPFLAVLQPEFSFSFTLAFFLLHNFPVPYRYGRI